MLTERSVIFPRQGKGFVVRHCVSPDINPLLCKDFHFLLSHGRDIVETLKHSPSLNGLMVEYHIVISWQRNFSLVSLTHSHGKRKIQRLKEPSSLPKLGQGEVGELGPKEPRSRLKQS